MKHYTRVKICGITRFEDALHASHQGVDAIGLVFHKKSPRYVTVEQARSITSRLPAFVTSVALFLDASVSEVNAVIEKVAIDVLQFHGNETAEFCRQFGKKYIKAFGKDVLVTLQKTSAEYKDACGILLDSHITGKAGGTGKQFDWSDIHDDIAQPLILAGGLNVSNVADAIMTVAPWAVDVSTGLENEDGMKDAELITAFMNKVRKADSELNG